MPRLVFRTGRGNSRKGNTTQPSTSRENPMTTAANVSFRLTPDLEAKIKALSTEPGEPVSTTVRNALDYLATVLAADLRSLRSVFTLAEVRAMASLATSITSDALSRTLLAFEVEEAVETGDLDDLLTRVDGRELVTKLQALSPGQVAAVTHALQRWWAQPDADRLSTSEGFARVGLIASDANAS